MIEHGVSCRWPGFCDRPAGHDDQHGAWVARTIPFDEAVARDRKLVMAEFGLSENDIRKDLFEEALDRYEDSIRASERMRLG